MEGQAIRRAEHLQVLGLVFAAALLELAFSSKLLAQVRAGSPSSLPNAAIVSDETGAADESDEPADEGVPPAVATSPSKSHSEVRHHLTASGVKYSAPVYSAAVEPTHATLKLKKDSWAYAGPESSSRPLERVRAGKFLNVTGSTHYYLQVKLKSGATGYVPLSAVDISRSEDKIMRLSTDAAVLSQPNRYGKRLSEVHEGHDVHVVGVSMNYMKIRMKSGLEGYIPMTAAE
jgi:hypothetical protein